MNTIRRIDWHIQLLIGICSVVMIWTIYLTLIGEAILGAWQLISALANTWAMLHSPFKKQIRIYWILVLVSLTFMVAPILLPEIAWGQPIPDAFNVLAGISIVGSWAIAWYYWRIYKQFIEHLEHRRELESLIRH